MFQNILKAPFMINDDFESILKPVTDNNDDNSNTKNS